MRYRSHSPGPMLSHLNEFVLSFVAVGAFFVAIEVGYRLGLRDHPRSDDGAKEHVQALQAALLGLWALLLGFNFAMASSRFDAARQGVIDRRRSSRC